MSKTIDTMTSCVLEGCESPRFGREWCGMHYARWRRFGDPNLGLDRERHGHARVGALTPTYLSWRAMKQRCNNPKNKDYDIYGGRGITYDPRWERFEPFLADMGERPEGMTLDRYPDKNGNYNKENCRWATIKEQNKNRRNQA